MSIILNPELERRINELVASGRYKSAEEVLREGLNRLDVKESSVAPQEPLDGLPIWEVAIRLGNQIPDEELAKIPRDFSQNLDHYLYGAPKETE